MFAKWRKISRSVRCGSVCVVALAAMMTGAPATAEIIVTPNADMGGVESLNIWGYNAQGMTIDLSESWGEIAPVGFTISDDGFPGPDSPFPGGTLIEFSKNIFNSHPRILTQP